MRVLLPPSETKRVGGAGLFNPAALYGDAALGATRATVRNAVVALSHGDESVAAKYSSSV